MEGGGAAAQGQQEPRQREEEKNTGRQPRAAEGGGGGMKFRVSAGAPHGVGALLLIGGAVIAGAAVVAWRHARRGKRDRQPAKHEVLDGGVAEDGKGGASEREIDRPDENLREEEEEEAEVGSKGPDNEGATEEIQEVRNDAETVANEPNSELVGKTGLDSRSSPTETSKHDDVDREPAEKFEQDSSTKLPEITAHDMDSVTVEKPSKISVKNNTLNEHNSTKKDDIKNDQDGIKNGPEDENPSKNDLKEERAPHDIEDVKASDQCSHSISRAGIVLDEQSLHGDSAQAESMENSPTAQLIMHQEQLLDDMTMDTEGEAAEAEPGKGTILEEDVPRLTEPVGLAGSLALSSLVKPAEKKEPELPGRFETGMKIEQDYTNGGMKERGLISKGGATPGKAFVNVDRRNSSMAVLALILALTIGITIVVRLYAPLTATKLQMDFP